MARFPYAAAGCEGHTAELGSFRPANNSPSRRHWPLRAPHVSLYSALFLRVLRPGPRRSPLAGGSDRHIIRSGREIARKIFPCSGVPFWAFCRLSPAAASAPFSPLRFTFPGDRRQGFPRRCFNGLSQEGAGGFFAACPVVPASLSRPSAIPFSEDGKKGDGPIRSVSLGDVRGMPYLAGASSAALASAAALAFSAWAFLMALYFSFSSAVATGEMASLGQTLVQSLQPTHLS